jgi:hypothetical protein
MVSIRFSKGAELIRVFSFKGTEGYGVNVNVVWGKLLSKRFVRFFYRNFQVSKSAWSGGENYESVVLHKRDEDNRSNCFL